MWVICHAIIATSAPRSLVSGFVAVYLSSRKQIGQICDSNYANFDRQELCLCFHCRKTLLICRIDFFFQNFSNRRKKNNQLDSHVGTQYFANTSPVFLVPQMEERWWARI